MIVLVPTMQKRITERCDWLRTPLFVSPWHICMKLNGRIERDRYESSSDRETHLQSALQTFCAEDSLE